MAGAYLLGSVSWSVVIVKLLQGLDVRTMGSGNAGATNVLRAAGKKAGVAVLALDVVKGITAVAVPRALDAPPAVVSGAAVAVVVGHVFPVFFGFRGGKGVATAAGALGTLAPPAMALGLVVFLVVVAWKRYVSLGSIVTAGALPAPGLVSTGSAGGIRGLAVAGVGGDRHPHRHQALQKPSAPQAGNRAPARRRRAMNERPDDCPRKIGILGAGSFGTALAVHLAGVGGHPVRLWARDPELTRRMAEERVNPEYLPDVELPPGLVPTSDMADLAGQRIPPRGRSLPWLPRGPAPVPAAFIPDGRPLQLVSATKGIEPETLARMSQVSAEEGKAAGREIRFAVLSGPTFAAELAKNVPSAAVIASGDAAFATEVRECLSTPLLRLYSSSDVIGVELGGDHQERHRHRRRHPFGARPRPQHARGADHPRPARDHPPGRDACGGQPRTFAGLAGLGDLVLTCTGGLSRNRKIGLDLAGGRSVADITGETHMVAEGVRNSIAIATPGGAARRRDAHHPADGGRALPRQRPSQGGRGVDDPRP